jgi:hypothetical protein
MNKNFSIHPFDNYVTHNFWSWRLAQDSRERGSQAKWRNYRKGVFWLTKSSVIVSKYSATNEIQCKKEIRCKFLNLKFFLIFLIFYFSNFLIFLISKCDLLYARDCIIFSCILLICDSMVSRAIWKNIHSWLFQRLQFW